MSMKSLKKKHYILAVLALLLIVGAAWAFIIYRQFCAPMLTGTATHYLYIDTDDTADSVYSKLSGACSEQGMKGKG